MANATQNTFLDPRTYGINNDRLQKRTWHVEAGVVADNDTIEVTHPDFGDEGSFPNVSAVLYTHNGGLVFNFTADSTNSDGDTMVLEAINPHDQDIREQKDMNPGPPNYVEIIHVLDGTSPASISSAEAAASWNADPLAARFAYAAATSAIELTLFPKGPGGHIRKGNGSTAINLMGKNSVDAVLNADRLFTAQPQGVNNVSWHWTYQSGKVTYINETGGAITAVMAVVTFF